MSTAVVTGAGSGVGRAVALRFAAEGWRVALVGRQPEPLAETAASAGSDSGRVAVFPCDVSTPDPVTEMAAAVLARFDDVDVLVNAAGINVTRRSFAALSLDDWHAVLATNLHGGDGCAPCGAHDLVAVRAARHFGWRRLESILANVGERPHRLTVLLPLANRNVVTRHEAAGKAAVDYLDAGQPLDVRDAVPPWGNEPYR